VKPNNNTRLNNNNNKRLSIVRGTDSQKKKSEILVPKKKVRGSGCFENYYIILYISSRFLLLLWYLFIASKLDSNFSTMVICLIDCFKKMDFILQMQPQTVQVQAREKKMLLIVTSSYSCMKTLRVTECWLVTFHGSK